MRIAAERVNSGPLQYVCWRCAGGHMCIVDPAQIFAGQDAIRLLRVAIAWWPTAKRES